MGWGRGGDTWEGGGDKAAWAPSGPRARQAQVVLRLASSLHTHTRKHTATLAYTPHTGTPQACSPPASALESTSTFMLGSRLKISCGVGGCGGPRGRRGRGCFVALAERHARLCMLMRKWAASWQWEGRDRTDSPPSAPACLPACLPTAHPSLILTARPCHLPPSLAPRMHARTRTPPPLAAPLPPTTGSTSHVPPPPPTPAHPPFPPCARHPRPGVSAWGSGRGSPAHSS